MVKMVGMLTTIDQVGSWDDAYNNHLFKNFSEAKKKVKHSDLDALDNDYQRERSLSKSWGRGVAWYFSHTALIR